MANIIRRDNRDVPRTRAQDLFGWDPFQMMDSLLRLDPYREGRLVGRGAEAWVPQFDVKETADGFVFKADLPGVKESDLEISVTGNVLTVSGKREDEHHEEGDQYFASERSYGTFTRSFALPDGADLGSVTADLEDGVLALRLPKKPEVQPKKITVGSGNAAEA